MRRWNGWGDEANHYPMPEGGLEFLQGEIGNGHVLPDAELDSGWRFLKTQRIFEHY